MPTLPSLDGACRGGRRRVWGLFAIGALMLLSFFPAREARAQEPAKDAPAAKVDEPAPKADDAAAPAETKNAAPAEAAWFPPWAHAVAGMPASTISAVANAIIVFAMAPPYFLVPPAAPGPAG